ncbi:MAG: AAA family ATPase [Myxococcales bacterium FL481]|nr:MAG: AAA family ATPase [Myxococcales bacterium FL481]
MRVSDIEFFRETTLRICGTLDIEEALSSAFAYVRRYIPIETMGLGFNDFATMQIKVVAKVAVPGARYVWTDGVPAIEMTPGLVEHSRSLPPSQPATISNGPEENVPALLNAFPGLHTDSAMFINLDSQGQNVGALLVSARGLGRFTAEHGRLLDSVRDPFSIAMMNARRYQEISALKDRLAEENEDLTADIKRKVGVEVVGAEFGLRGVMEQVRQVSASNSPTLLLGETGTGKEVIANAIHTASNRGNGPMISMQCGAIPEALLDSELFGHEKGAFTGAFARKRGRFERAHGGTLFLDEIGELSPEAQVKLLRVLQERRLERVGGVESVEVDVRVIAATHRDLEGMVRNGTFREDLWYRLNVFPIRIPPLRLRREDIPSLVRSFVERKAREMNLAVVPHVTGADVERLKRYDWPGNVRELQNIVERALIVSSGDTLVFPELAATTATSGKVEQPHRDGLKTLDEAVEAHLRAVLKKVRWQVAGAGGAAEVLGMNPSTLRFRMKKLGIERPGAE